jgi:SAM-dependent methyltransferase
MTKKKLDVVAVAKATEAKFAEGNTYGLDTIMRSPKTKQPLNYFDRLMDEKLALVLKYSSAKALVVDVCCATAEHAIELAPKVGKMIALDYTERYLKKGQELAKKAGVKNIEFVQGSALKMPLKNGSADVAYCYSSLYVIPEQEKVVADMGRILKKGGVGIFDFININSLNKFVSHTQVKGAETFLLTPTEMLAAVAGAGLEVVEIRRFQILPLWGNRPLWLAPFALKPFHMLMAVKINGTMLDEWICKSLPWVACRYVVVARKK